MRGGKAIRGRGGRGRGDESKESSIVTRSNSGKSEPRVTTEIVEQSKSSLVEGNQMEVPEDRPMNSNTLESNLGSDEDEDETWGRAEVDALKQQMAEIQVQLRKLQNTPLPGEPNDKEEPFDVAFPALNAATSGNRSHGALNLSVLPSWKDKVTLSKTQIGMPLKYIPPMIENGQHIVQIESNDVVDLISVWESAVVIYVVGGNISSDILRGYIRKHWTCINMPVIHAHEDGYFIVKFANEKECEEILNGGPYFLNRAPMVVKRWSKTFDFQEEILRVIPVWIRLPSLPLHCWGVETLSRIVSAVGVPIIADDCTAKQLKVSYARVLVEVDITQEFIKEIKVRDDSGREFLQKAIPEWRPFYCQKCHKIGHECKEENRLESQKVSKQTEEGNSKGESKKWIPTNIARIIQGLTSVEELKAKINSIGESNSEHRQEISDMQHATSTGAAGGQKPPNSAQKPPDQNSNNTTDLLSAEVCAAGG
ncbi:unnamed protein product [Amaranthus hypochondriacus]